jgi:curli production assembly/transport component CsgG
VGPPPPETYREPEVITLTKTQSDLRNLPLPPSPIPVAVYQFADQTGQFKPQSNVQTLSRAVSQGGAAILIQALEDAGRGGWFKLLERHGLANLLKERQIIQEMRARYLGESQVNPQALPPLLFAGVVLEGGIVGFDSNTLTGGAGARFLGVGGDVEYRQNTVTVNLRAVSVKTGEILANVTTTKTIAAMAVQGSAFRFIDFDELLEVEAGITTNEPGAMALRRAIEKAVLSLVLEGTETGLWSFADPDAAAGLIRSYREQHAGAVPAGWTEARPPAVDRGRDSAGRSALADRRVP